MTKDLNKRGVPVSGQPKRVAPVGTYGVLYEYPDYKNQQSIRYYSTSDEALLKAAVLMLVCSDLGFQVVLHDNAYKTQRLVKLAVGRGTQWIGPLTPDHDFWISVDDHKTITKTPEEAVDRFFAIWRAVQIGDYWVDAGLATMQVD